MSSLNERVALGSHYRLARRNRLGPQELLQDPLFAQRVPRVRQAR